MSISEDRKGPGRPAAEGAVDVRRALLLAARDCIIERGFEAASVSTIAANAGVNPAMISYYFGNKQALGEAVMHDAIAPLVEQLNSVSRDLANDGPGEKMLEFISDYMRVLAAHPWIPKLVVREVLPQNGRFRELFLREVSARGVTSLRGIVGLIAQDKNQSGDVSLLPFISLMIFPFLAAPMLESTLGINLSNKKTVDALINNTVAAATQLINGNRTADAALKKSRDIQ